MEYILADPVSWCLVIDRQRIDIVGLSGKQQNVGAHDLCAALIQPIGIPNEVSNLMIFRDGLLNLLPFDALREDSGKYLGDRTAISYLPSAESFYLLAIQGNRPRRNTKVFAVGAVPYEALVHSKTPAATPGSSSTSLANLPNSREAAMAATAGVPSFPCRPGD